MFTDCSIANDNLLVYEKYEKLKKEKGTLSIDMLDVGDLKEMWWEENVPDSCIASLFSVTAKDIRKLRYKYDIKQTTLRGEDLVRTELLLKRMERQLNI